MPTVLKKTCFLFILSLITMFYSGPVLLAGDVTIFGPQKYTRTSGDPNIYNGSFTGLFTDSITSGKLIVLNGNQTGTNRIEDAISSAEVYVNGQLIFGPADFNKNVYCLESPIPLQANNTFSIKLQSTPGSYITVSFVEDIAPPTAGISAVPDAIKIGQNSTLTWTSTFANNCSIEPGIGSVDCNGSKIVSPGASTTYNLAAAGPSGSVTAGVTVTVTNPGLSVAILATPEAIEDGGFSTLTWQTSNAQSVFIDNGIGIMPANGSIAVSPENTTVYTITVTGSQGTKSAQATVKVLGYVENLPKGSFGEQYQDLIPEDATVGIYDSKRFSLVTGHVNDINGSPLPDVSISIHGHPEYGTTLTDEVGQFTIPVEGGTTMTVNYVKEGYLSAQRQVYVPWNDYAITDTIQMIIQDTKSMTLTFDGNPSTVITHHSTTVSDASGSRSCTMIFTGDNAAHLMNENGNDVYQLSKITVRATEFTKSETMPAVLPPNSVFTYCVEMGVDGAQRVRFDKPVIAYVNNFLGFNVGEKVPVGYYDRDRSVWVPSDNGVVVKLLDTNGDGIVDALDNTGDNQPDDLDHDGSFSDEVIGLDNPALYPSGSTFWRVSFTHFTPWDCNWPYGPPSDAIAPNPNGITNGDQQGQEEEDCKGSNASFVEERSRIFHENIPTPGTDLTLHYASNRVKGYKTSIMVPASGSSVPNSLKNIIVNVEVAGNTFEEVLAPLPNQKAEFEWDGFDDNGREVLSPITAKVSIGFVYNAVYYNAGNFAQAFAQAGSGITSIRARQEIIIWKFNDITVNPPKSKGKGIGTEVEGWTLSNCHHMNTNDPSTLFKGDGTKINNNAIIIDTYAGVPHETGNGPYYSGDGGPATKAYFYRPGNIAMNPSGELCISDSGNERIRKISTSGIITTIAGNGQMGFSGDGGLATEAKIDGPGCLAFNSSGELFFVDSWNHRIRKVDRNGIITTVVGTGGYGYSGDGGPATAAQIYDALGLVFNPSGELFFIDDHNGIDRIRKVDTNGIITTIAGNGSSGYYGDGGPAIKASLYFASSLAFNSSGELFIADEWNERIRKISTSGIITTIAGNGEYGYSGDGGPATNAKLFYPSFLAFNLNGELFFADSNGSRIRKIDTSGIITTIAGNGSWGYSGNGGLAINASLSYITGVAIGASGEVYISDNNMNNVRKIALPSSFTGLAAYGDIPFADDNGLGYIMSSSGLHKKTINLNTGIILQTFGYDSNNNLVSVTDNFGNQTIIERDAVGMPTAIISPDGLTTTLTVNADKHLARINYPDNSHYDFEYTSDGLMTAKIEPDGNRFAHQFDSRGRLIDVLDDEGGHWTYNRTIYSNGNILTDVITGEGNHTTYLDHTASTGAYTSTITDPTGAVTLFSQSADGLTVTKSLACGMTDTFKYGLDPQYKTKFVKEMRETTPASRTSVTLINKTYSNGDLDDAPEIMTETISLNGKITTFQENTLNGTKIVTSPEGRTITTTYNPSNLLTESLSIPGLYDTNYEYDSRGRLASIYTNTRETIFEYNSSGFLASITDPEDNTTSYSYDSVGRVTEIARPDTSTLDFSYDNNGNMVVFSNPSAISHTFSYNAVNLKDSYLTPQSGSYQYQYDKDRRLVRTIFPTGKQINYVYDDTRLSQILTPEKNINLSYLCSTKLGSMTAESESISYGYDGSLVMSETMSGTLNQILSYGYNNDFNITGFTYAGTAQTNTYDNDGLLIGAGNFTISRNAGNGLPEAVTGGSLTLGRTFNGYGEVESQDVTVGSSAVVSWDVDRDNNGRITNKTEYVNGVTSTYVYSYDSMGRLETVTKNGSLAEQYQYSTNGIRTYEINTLRGISGRSLAYSNEDHLLTSGGTTYNYNLDGYLTTKTIGANTTVYDYSSRGELLSVNLPNGNVISYMYDPLGRRIAKKVNGTITEKYLWQGLTRLLAVYNGSNALIMRFEYADSRMPVAMTRGGVTYYLAYDQTGSLKAVTNASGSAVKVIDYDSFGNIISDTNPSLTMPFGFAGGLYDPDTDLIRFGYRDYDPDTGRWTAKDPILFAGGDSDIYGYCLNDPINNIDLLGLDFASTYSSNLKATNNFFFNFPTSLTRTAAGLITSGSVAKTVGTVTPLQALFSLGNGGIGGLGVAETIGSAMVNSLINGALSALALEGGIGFGSLISSISVYGTDQTITDWWADYWWNLFHNDSKSTPCY